MTALILVVDDLEPNVKLLEAKLAAEYYDIISASDGYKAIEMAKQHSPDLILLDVMMPGMDGFTACRQLKSMPETAHIPVVMVTALSEPSDRVQGLQSGADDFLTKPINDVQLLARVRSLLRMKQLIDELRLRGQTSSEIGEVTGINLAELGNIHGASVLLVDDDVVEGRNIIARLEAEGLKVTQAQSGADAIQLANQAPFDLTLVSTQLMDSDGLRLCSQFRSQEVTRHIPQIIMVDEHDTKHLVKGLEMGVNDYLMSPVDVSEMACRVRTNIRRKKYQDALKSSYQQTVTMAIKDNLTGVYNRHYLEAHMKNLAVTSLDKSKPLSALMMDMDYFKSVNDGFGHDVGDEILRQLAGRIGAQLRASDMVARFGGEEFVVVLPGAPLHIAREVAERIRVAVESTPFIISHPQGQLYKTVSIGASMLEHYAGSPDGLVDELIKGADEALYKAKHDGRNRVIVAGLPEDQQPAPGASPVPSQPGALPSAPAPTAAAPAPLPPAMAPAVALPLEPAPSILPPAAPALEPLPPEPQAFVLPEPAFTAPAPTILPAAQEAPTPSSPAFAAPEPAPAIVEPALQESTPAFTAPAPTILPPVASGPEPLAPAAPPMASPITPVDTPEPITPFAAAATTEVTPAIIHPFGDMPAAAPMPPVAAAPNPFADMPVPAPAAVESITPPIIEQTEAMPPLSPFAAPVLQENPPSFTVEPVVPVAPPQSAIAAPQTSTPEPVAAPNPFADMPPSVLSFGTTEPAPAMPTPTILPPVTPTPEPLAPAAPAFTAPAPTILPTTVPTPEPAAAAPDAPPATPSFGFASPFGMADQTPATPEPAMPPPAPPTPPMMQEPAQAFAPPSAFNQAFAPPSGMMPPPSPAPSAMEPGLSAQDVASLMAPPAQSHEPFSPPSPPPAAAFAAPAFSSPPVPAFTPGEPPAIPPNPFGAMPPAPPPMQTYDAPPPPSPAVTMDPVSVSIPAIVEEEPKQRLVSLRPRAAKPMGSKPAVGGGGIGEALSSFLPFLKKKKPADSSGNEEADTSGGNFDYTRINQPRQPESDAATSPPGGSRKNFGEGW